MKIFGRVVNYCPALPKKSPSEIIATMGDVTPNIMYKEVQRPRQFWIWAIVVLVAGGAWIQMIERFFVDGQRAGGTGMDVLTLVLWIIFGLAFPVFTAIIKLEIAVTDMEIGIRFFPLIRRRINIQDIVSVEARTYKPLREYGGWGIRYGMKSGKAYNMSGDRGVQLVLNDGSRVLLGSQKTDRLEEAIRQAKG